MSCLSCKIIIFKHNLINNLLTFAFCNIFNIFAVLFNR